MNQLLERHSGNIEVVARVLETTPDSVKAMIAGDPWLAGKWMGKPVDVQDREPIDVAPGIIDDFDPQPIVPKDQALLAAVESQDRKLKSLNWGALGIKDPEQVNMFKEFERFVGANIVSTLDATHGGMLFAFARGSVIFKKLSDAVEALMAEDPKVGAVAIASEAGQALYDRWLGAAHLLVKLNADATKAGHLRVMMESKAREVMDKKSGSKGRPGFGKAKPAQTSGERVVTVDVGAKQ